MNADHRSLVTAATVLGIGLGGFVDGILFHQILQLHSMLSATLPKVGIANIEINMFWDGLFHAFTWIMTTIGVVMLFRAGARRVVPWSGKAFTAALFLGWGLFNLIEGVIDHYLLGIHHVVERFGLSVADHAFIASAIIFIVVGWLVVRANSGEHV